jgi:uncharacterized protein
MPAPNNEKRLIITILGILLGIAFVLYILLPFGFAAYASIRHNTKVGEPPEGFAGVTLTADDGIAIAAWYRAPENGTAVVLAHGSTGSRESLRPYARFLADAGYGVLAIDLRGHGQSGGRANAFGWECVKDIRAAVDYLEGLGVQSIAALGLSLGGEVLLRAAGGLPQIRAVISDGATQSMLADYLSMPSNQSFARSWTTRVLYRSVQLLTGQIPPETTILDSIASTDGTRLLLIAAEEKGGEVGYNRMFAEAARGRAELWSVPRAGHTQAFSLYPEEYNQRVLGFLSIL